MDFDERYEDDDKNKLCQKWYQTISGSQKIRKKEKWFPQAF
jgi:hypothetical protein